MKDLAAIRNPKTSVPTQVSGEDQLVELWIKTQRSPHTRRAYSRRITHLLATTSKPLAQITLADLVHYYSSLEGGKASTQAAAHRAIRSLFRYAHRLGFLAFNPAAAIPVPRVARRVDRRTLDQDQTHGLLGLTDDPRDRGLLSVLYYGGLRAAEASRLLWRDMAEREIQGEGTGQLTVSGKGGRVRTVVLGRSAWRTLLDLRDHVGSTRAEANRPPPAPDSPMFLSRKGGPLGTRGIFDVVRKAAKRAGITEAVSPHWLRHAHATHAVQRGCPLDVLQATLGHVCLTTTQTYIHSNPETSSALWL
jgi:site-specific recombinase XerD